jgi:hypothetical protein
MMMMMTTIIIMLIRCEIESIIITIRAVKAPAAAAVLIGYFVVYGLTNKNHFWNMMRYI